MSIIEQGIKISADKLQQFVFRAVDEVGATLNAALVVMGDKLGLYRALAGAGPLAPAELAQRTGTAERYVREWLNAQAAGGYVEYDPDSGRYTLPPEQTVALTDPDSPVYLPGFFQITLGSVLDSPKIVEAARSGTGFGWHGHVHDVHEGCERFFRPGYNANLISGWLPALDGVVAKLERGALVADVGCGEAWELDHYLHENPEQKTAIYAWFTDFVGWLPMPDGGEREPFLTADYNAEMIEHIARFPRVRDRAIFVGEPDDIVPGSFGAGLPPIRQWTQEHYDFAGYITGFDPAAFGDRQALRADLGYAPQELVCIVTVGGSGVGAPLLGRVIASFPEAKHLVPQLRMIIVAGPRIDPSTLPAADGLEIRAYVPDLYRHLAACDLAVVQGGLTTAMELTANRRPFIYFPLKHHFEQTFHVRHRLERYRAGRRMDFDHSPPDAIAAAIAQEIGRDVSYRPVAADGAARAAALIAEML